MLGAMADAAAPMVWVDLEMTGLDPQTCAIVEIATIITDASLSVIAEGPCLVIHQPEGVLDAMSAFVRDLHTRSGLLDRIRSSTTSLADAEAQTAAFLAARCQKGMGVLSGNSLWKDRAFLERYMPSVVEYLHYRIVDVSTI